LHGTEPKGDDAVTNVEKYRRYAEKVRIFNGLPPEEVDHILHQGRVLHYHAGMSIFHEGALGNALFIVLKGEVGIYHQNELIASCVVGDAFGEMAVLNHTPRTASAAAILDTRVFTLEEKQLNAILQREVSTRLLLNVIHVISERLEAANKANHHLRQQLKTATP
jgi:CRP-like cAMP-binding protein